MKESLSGNLNTIFSLEGEDLIKEEKRENINDMNFKDVHTRL